MSKTKPAIDTLTYEQAFDELEKIVAALEGDDIIAHHAVRGVFGAVGQPAAADKVDGERKHHQRADASQDTD